MGVAGEPEWQSPKAHYALRPPPDAGDISLVATMRIKLSSVFVDDQAKALTFYTEVLGFVKKTDIPIGEARWLTVASPEGPEETELLLEPNVNPAAKTYQESLFQQGIPINAFAVDDIQAEYERLRGLGVEFFQEPMEMGPVTVAVFEDTCGNLIQIYQE